MLSRSHVLFRTSAPHSLSRPARQSLYRDVEIVGQLKRWTLPYQEPAICNSAWWNARNVPDMNQISPQFSRPGKAQKRCPELIIR
jgi:hypothetical protein